MLESQREQAERRRVMLDEARARDRLRDQQREQGSTFLAQTHSEMGGRFSSVGAQMVVGADPVANYPAAAPHQRDPCGIEPPLGYRIDELEPAIAPPVVEAQASGPAEAPASPSLSEHAAGSSTPLRRRKL
jgi:hypothetical protein